MQNSHGRYRQLLFLIGQLKKFLLNHLAKLVAPTEGSVFPSMWNGTYPVLVCGWPIEKKTSLKPFLQINWKHQRKVLYKVSSNQNERWTTQVQPTEPLVYIWWYHLKNNKSFFFYNFLTFGFDNNGIFNNTCQCRVLHSSLALANWHVFPGWPQHFLMVWFDGA